MDPHDEPGHQSDLGRAIARGHRDASADRALAHRRARVRADGEAVVKKFAIPAPDGHALIRYGLPFGLALGLAFVFGLIDAVFFAPVFLVSVLVIGALSLRSPPVLTVGADGLVLHGRLIPYATLRGVHLDSTLGFAEEGGEYDRVMVERYTWALYLSLEEGTLPLMSGTSPIGPPQSATEILEAVEEARAAWLSGLDVDAEVVSRGGRTGAAWLQALRRLGAQSGAYRVSALHVERLARILADRRTRPSARAAAAVALAASGDASATGKLRIAAETMVEPRLRIALEQVADGAQDEAMAEALEALEEAERETQRV